MQADYVIIAAGSAADLDQSLSASVVSQYRAKRERGLPQPICGRP
jgi:hypothetical protein